MTPIPFGAWTPDLADLGTDRPQDVTNVLPTANGYGPFPALETISEALPGGERCRGAITIRRTASFYDLFVGTKTKLYRYNNGSRTFTDVSGGGYSLPDGDFWQFALFGDKVVAVQGNNDVQVFDLTTPTAFTTLAGSPPRARFVAVIGDFLVLGCIAGRENSLRWSALNDITAWTIGTDLADEQLFPDGGAVRGIAGAEAGIVFQEDTVRRMSLVGGAQIFQFDVIARNRTLLAPYSIAQTGPYAFVCMESGFYQYGPDGEQPIGAEKVDRWYKTRAHRDWAPQTLGSIDPVNHRVYWAFRSADEPDERYDAVLVYDWLLARFSKLTGAFQTIFPALSAGYTLEELDAFGTLETLPYGLDSAYWGGGNPGLGGFDRDGRFGFFGGENLEATVTGGEQQFNPPVRSFVSAVRLIGDAPGHEVSVGGREALTAAAGYAAARTADADGATHHRVSARYHGIRVRMPAAARWSFVNGVEVDAVTDGNR